MKYGLTSETINYCGRELIRIQAIKDFGDVKAGDFGGYVEHFSNLSQKGDCWIYDKAFVLDNACVSENAKVYNNARVYDSARVYGDSRVCDSAEIYDNACVFGNAKVYNSAEIYGGSSVYENAEVYNDAKIYEDAEICGYSEICGGTEVFGDAIICDGKKDSISRVNDKCINPDLKISSIKITDGVITEISANVDINDDYKDLKGYTAPRTFLNPGIFTGAIAINRILKDMGIDTIELDVEKAAYWEYGKLNKRITPSTQIVVNGAAFTSSRTIGTSNINEVTLTESENIDKINFRTSKENGSIDITYKEYLAMCSIWNDKIEFEEDFIVDLKKVSNVKTFDGYAYDYYSKYATDEMTIVRMIASSEGFKFKGVFSVSTSSINKTLLEFKAIEESTNLTTGKTILKGSKFYISGDLISYMQ